MDIFPEPEAPKDNPFTSNGSGVSYTTDFPVVDPVPTDDQRLRIDPRDIVPGSFPGVGLFNFGGVNGLYIDGNKGIYVGNIDPTLAPFFVDFEGNVTAAGVTVTQIIIGTSPNWFRVDTNGNIWSGAATFGAAPFSVSNAGVLTAASATITGPTVISGTFSSPTITTGTLVDGSSNNIVDSTGLVSTTQFDSANIQGNFPFTTSSTTPVAVTSFSLSFTLTRSTKVFLYAMFSQTTGAASAAEYSIFVDGVDKSDTPTNGGSTSNLTLNTITTIGAGAHTVQIYAYAVLGTSSATVNNVPAELGYIVLGK